MTLEKMFKEYKAKEEAITKQLIDEINKISSNQKINFINSNCFIISIKDLNTLKLSPDYYNTKKQKEFILEIINSERNLSDKINVLNTIATDGKYRQNVFYPDIINGVKNIVSVISDIENKTMVQQ